MGGGTAWVAGTWGHVATLTGAAQPNSHGRSCHRSSRHYRGRWPWGWASRVGHRGKLTTWRFHLHTAQPVFVLEARRPLEDKHETQQGSPRRWNYGTFQLLLQEFLQACILFISGERNEVHRVTLLWKTVHSCLGTVRLRTTCLTPVSNRGVGSLSSGDHEDHQVGQGVQRTSMVPGT